MTVRARLLVAAGGGGDALAALAVQKATSTGSERVHYASYSWERLIVDPVPGPRNPSSFDALDPVGRLNYRITTDSRAKPPANSLLPRLVSEFDIDMYLLDPRGGAVGMGEQLAELTGLLDVDLVQLVDVGGDVLARGDEPNLRSPLADALVLAAASRFETETEVIVAGPGLDGELSQAEVLDRIERLAGTLLSSLESRHVLPFASALDWCPSDVTGLLFLAARGVHGVAELRDGGLRAVLSDAASTVWRVGHQRAVEGNAIAKALLSSLSLDEAETVLRAAGRESDIDYERRKSSRPPVEDRVASASDVLDWLTEHSSIFSSRGIDFVTLRRTADLMGLSPSDVERVRSELRQSRSLRYLPPVFAIHLGPAGLEVLKPGHAGPPEDRSRRLPENPESGR